MLWLKLWLETRARLLLGAAMLAFVCAVIVLFGDGPRHAAGGQMTWAAYIWSGVYKDYVRNVFVVLVIVLGGGTLLQERAHGTAGFTLSLPVTRRALLLSRAAVGLLEVCALAAIPAVLIPALSAVAGRHYPAAQALEFALLWVVGGSVVFAAALLWTSVVPNEYVAWTATFLSLMIFEAAINYAPFSPVPSLDVLGLMNGTVWPSFDKHVAVLAGAAPWRCIATMLAAAAALLLASDRITHHSDYP